MRQALRSLPDGDAVFEDIFDGDGIIEQGDTEDRTFKVRIALKKRGDTVAADFAGTDPAVSGPMNAPLSVTASGVYCALKMVVDPQSLIPPNSGCWRAVEVTAPPGCVANAQEPSPVVYANHEMSHRIADMTFAAMAQIAPGPGDGGLPGHQRRHHLRRRRLPHRGALRVLREHQGRLRRAADEGRHQRRLLHRQQHAQHPDRGAGDELPAAGRGVFRRARQRRRRAPSAAAAACAGPGASSSATFAPPHASSAR